MSPDWDKVRWFAWRIATSAGGAAVITAVLSAPGKWGH